jgi:hypothetical protein
VPVLRSWFCGWRRGDPRSGAKPLRKRAVVLEPEKPPGELDHAAPDPRIAGPGKTLLASFCATLVRRSGETGIAAYGSAVP